jgi:hypothetical protein
MRDAAPSADAAREDATHDAATHDAASSSDAASLADAARMDAELVDAADVDAARVDADSSDAAPPRDAAPPFCDPVEVICDGRCVDPSRDSDGDGIPNGCDLVMLTAFSATGSATVDRSIDATWGSISMGPGYFTLIVTTPVHGDFDYDRASHAADVDALEAALTDAVDGPITRAWLVDGNGGTSNGPESFFIHEDLSGTHFAFVRLHLESAAVTCPIPGRCTFATMGQWQVWGYLP